MPETVEGFHYRTGEAIRLFLREGTISRIEPMENVAVADMHTLPRLAPGLVDLQINGCRGFDFNTAPLQPETVQVVSRLLLLQGVTTYYPTVISNSDEGIRSSVSAIAAACREDEYARDTVGGIHLEGPFISPEDGPRGAHAKAHVLAPDWDLFQRWVEASQGLIRIVTLSPEWPEASRFIERCVLHGIKVSIGHTAATPEQIREAVAAGASMSTHWGNGAHLTLPRHPNYLWEQLAADELWTNIIGDGFHLPDSVIKVVLKAKNPKVILVSDAVQLSGMAPGLYDLHIGGRVVLTPQGRLHLAGQPQLLAGSAMLLLRGVERLAAAGLCSLEDAWDLASLRPSECMNLSAREGIKTGAPADLVQFHIDGDRPGQLEIRVVQTWKKGKPTRL